MRILWVTPQFPCLRSGGQTRQYHLLRFLARTNQIHVLSLVKEDEKGEIEKLASLGIEIDAVPFVPAQKLGRWSNRFHSWIQLLLDPKPHLATIYHLDGLQKRMMELLAQRQYDLIQLQFLYCAPLGAWLDKFTWVLEEHNTEYMTQERLIPLSGSRTRRLASSIDARKLRRWEKKWVQRCTACLAVSDYDASLLRQLSPNTPIYVIPNGVALDDFSHVSEAATPRSGLLFLGNLGYAPNTDAIHYFCKQIFPGILAEHPDTRLTIIGPNAPASVAHLDTNRGIDFVGYVDSVLPYLHRARVCVVPMRSGSGTRLKILEAMAAGLPVVSTTLGAEGLDVTSGREILLADTSEEFAAATCELMYDDCLAEKLRSNALQLVQDKYDWRQISTKMEMAYDQIIRLDVS